MPGTTQITLGPIPHFKNTWVSGMTCKKDGIVFHNGSSFVALVNNPSTEPSFTYDSATGTFTCSDGWGLLAVGDALDIIGSLKSGSLVPAKAGNLASWEDRGSLSVEDTWADPVRTSAGDVSIDSSVAAKLKAIVAKKNFYASALRATGFNLLHSATAVGTGYYFLVPALPFGSFGTSEKPNGLLFTDNEHHNLTPTVYFKPLSSGVPQSVTDGSLCAYTDSNGYRFFNTSEAGYIIVSGITLANTCAHIAWSRRYDEFVSPSASSDAGSSVTLSSIIHAIHSYDLMVAVGNVGDRIDFGASAAAWTRMCDRVQPSWTNTDNGDGTYTHSATISTMKPDGAAECGNLQLSISGKTISYIDDSASATSAYVYYELLTPATGSVSISPSFSIEDWGLEQLVGVSGEAYITTLYAQGYPDTLAGMAGGGTDAKLQVLAEAVVMLAAKVSSLSEAVARPGDIAPAEVDALEYKKCLYPVVLYGSGSPSSSTNPTNLPSGLPWDGCPIFIGQAFVDTTNGKVYMAKGVNAVSDWLLLN